MDDKWIDHGNLIVLIGWMADQPEYDKGDLAYAVEKPWKFETQFNEAVREQDSRDAKDKMMLNARYGKRHASLDEAPHAGVSYRRHADCPGCGKRLYATVNGEDPLKRHIEHCELYLAMSDDES